MTTLFNIKDQEPRISFCDYQVDFSKNVVCNKDAKNASDFMLLLFSHVLQLAVKHHDVKNDSPRRRAPSVVILPRKRQVARFDGKIDFN